MTHNILLVASAFGWAYHVNHSWAIQNLHHDIQEASVWGWPDSAKYQILHGILPFPGQTKMVALSGFQT